MNDFTDSNKLATPERLEELRELGKKLSCTECGAILSKREVEDMRCVACQDEVDELTHHATCKDF